MIEVKNRHAYKGKGVYVGRPGPLGNPFVIGRDGSRLEVIAKYRQWLRNEWQKGGGAKEELLRLARWYKASESLTLICSCAPKACHADVLKTAIESLVEKAMVKGGA